MWKPGWYYWGFQFNFIDNIYFNQIVDRIYPTELQLNKQILPILRHLFWIWIYVYVANGTVSTKIYDKRDDFDFDIKSGIGTQGEVGYLWKCFKTPGGIFYWPF